MPTAWTTLGVCAALASNAAWLFGSIVFSRVLADARPLGINLGRGLITLAYVGLCLLFVGFDPMDRSTFFRLGASGLLGMALGDSLFFMALARLGPRLTVLIGMLGPVFTLVLSVLWLHEHLSPSGWCGVALTLTGVSFVLTSGVRAARPPDVESSTDTLAPGRAGRPHPGMGVLLAAAASLSMSIGIILAKEGVATVTPLQAVFVRMLWSVMALTLVGGLGGQLKTWLSPYRDLGTLRRIHAAVVVVVFGGFCLSMLALKVLEASVAATLTATEPLFALAMTAVALKQPIHGRELLGAALGVVGVILIYLSPI